MDELRKTGELLVDTIKGQLVDARKVATKRTINSIQYEIAIQGDNIKITITADKSLLFIESGRRKGAKLPVKNVNGKFELVDRLQEWVDAVGYTGSHYLLAKGISERGIKPTNIINAAVDKISDEISDLLAEYAATNAIDLIGSQVNKLFTSIPNN